MTKYSFLIIFAMACIFTSCHDEQDDPNVDQSESKSNDLEYFSSAFICPGELSEDGKELFFSGDVIDPAFPNILTIGVENLEEATEIFKAALPIHEKAESRVEIEGDNIIFTATDENDKELCQIVFSVSDGNNPYAFVSFTNGASISGINRIEFIDKDNWPDNRISFYESKYCIGDVVKIDTSFYSEHYSYNESAEGMQPAICIKEASSQEAGMLMCLTSQTYTAGSNLKESFAPMNVAKTAAKIISKDWELYVGLFKNIGRDIEESPCVWTSEVDDIWFTAKIYYINIKTNYVDWNDLFNKKENRRGMIVRTFK